MKRLLCIVVVLLTISCRKASVSLLNRLESGCLSESVIGLVDSYIMAGKMTIMVNLLPSGPSLLKYLWIMMQ